MEWRNWYLDAVLVPCALLMMFCYHVFLWYKVRTEPFSTIVGTNSRARRSWVAAIMKVLYHIKTIYQNNLSNLIISFKMDVL